MSNGQEILRFALMGGLAGFAVFCASYAFVVWRKRNPPHASRGLRFSIWIAMVGLAGLAIFWLSQELAPRHGVIEGKNLFVVHSRSDASLVRVTQDEMVRKGDLLAEFVPPAMEAQLSVLDNRIAEGQSRVHGLEHRSLPLDPLLIQRQAQARTELDRARSLAFDLRRSLRELEKDKLAQRIQWTRERSQLELELESARRQRESYDSRIKIGEAAVARMAELQRREIVTSQLVDDRNATLISLKLERDAAEGNLKAMNTRLRALEQSYANNEKATSQHEANLREELAQMERSEERLGESVAELDDKIAADQKRAAAETSSDIQTSRHQLATLVADRERVIASSRVTAPEDARVVYRHPAPGLVPSDAPILALASDSGFAARMLVRASEVEQLGKADHVKFSVEKPMVGRSFPGQYQRYEKISDDPDHVIALFDVQPSREVVTALATTPDKSVPAKLEWRPDPASELPFQAGIIAVAVGMLGAFASSARRRVRTEAIESAAPFVDQSFAAAGDQSRIALGDGPQLVSSRDRPTATHHSSQRRVKRRSSE